MSELIFLNTVKKNGLTILPLTEMKYSKGNVLGDGTYGKVYKAQISKEDTDLVLKISKFDDDGINKVFIREVANGVMLGKMGVNIPQISSVFVNSKKGVHVSQYSGDTLANKLDDSDLSFDEIISYSFDLLHGLSLSHSVGLLHRDLKPQNLMILNNKLIIGDWGLSKFINEGSHTPGVCTSWYRSPELLLGTKIYSSSIDMWSVGCLIGEMLLGYPIFPGNTEIHQLLLIYQTIGTPTRTNNGVVFPIFNPIELKHFFKKSIHSNNDHFDEVCYLIGKMLNLDPVKRISASESLNDPLFSRFKKYQQPSKLNLLKNFESPIPTFQNIRYSFITNDMVIKTREWMFEVHVKMALLPETFDLSLILFDHYVSLNIKTLNPSQLQLIGAGCLWTVSKYEEEFCCDEIELIRYTNNSYNVTKILEIELNILHSVPLEVFTFTKVIDFTRELLKFVILSDQEKLIVGFVIHTALVYSVDEISLKISEMVGCSFVIAKSISDGCVQRTVSHQVISTVARAIEMKDEILQNKTDILINFVRRQENGSVHKYYSGQKMYQITEVCGKFFL